MTQDFAALMTEIYKRGGFFSFNPSSERNYDKFPDFQRNISSGLDFNQLNKWLNSHKKDMSCPQKWRTCKVEWTVWITNGPFIQKKKWEREQPVLKHVNFQDRLRAHVHPNGFARLCFCLEMHLLSNAVFWLASTFKERCMTILKTAARETTFFMLGQSVKRQHQRGQ